MEEIARGISGYRWLCVLFIDGRREGVGVVRYGRVRFAYLVRRRV